MKRNADDLRLIQDDFLIRDIGPQAIRVRDLVKHLDHAKREIVAARYFDIPAEAIEAAANIRSTK